MWALTKLADTTAVARREAVAPEGEEDGVRLTQADFDRLGEPGVEQ